MLLAATVVSLLASSQASAESVSTGTPGRGSLKGGVSLPPRGDGFQTYSVIGNQFGRQYVHSRVQDVLVDAFSALHRRRPDRVFVVGETGLKDGGRFRPHRSHQNGLSVDVLKIIVAPEYVERVLAAGGARMAGLAPRFMRKPAWVRHDEHVHVDFRVVAHPPAPASGQGR